MPPEHFPRYATHEEFIAGRCMEVEGSRLVPVSRIAVSAGGSGMANSHLGGIGGSAKTEVIGTWVVDQAGTERWLPATPVPPGPEGTWNDWLAARPELVQAVRTALATFSRERER
ncbi:MAG: hypothetical protein KIT79_04555 [Deltaproteobacteria bacterium]|nr:hypothetical protein [Deltaproteobacteria bacterium]